jgi:hypothetical protein
MLFNLRLADCNMGVTAFGWAIDQSRQIQIIDIICAANHIQTWNLRTFLKCRIIIGGETMMLSD